MKTIKTTAPTTSVFLILIVCILSGCGTTGSTQNNILDNTANQVASSKTQFEIDNNQQETQKGFFARQKEFLVAKQEFVIDKADDIGLNEEEIKKAKKRLKEGWDLDVFGMFKVNASSDGLKYEKRFLKDEAGRIETGVDDDGDPYFVLAIAF